MRIFLPSLIACLFTLAACSEHKKEKEEDSKFLVTTPLLTDTSISREYVCQIRSASHIELRSQEKGYLEKVYVDEGQFVKKGQLMFQIMPLVYQAEMQKADAERNFAQLEYNNTKSLADSNIVSLNELALAKARLDKAQAELTLAKVHLGFTEIRAPFSGIMDRFYSRLGSLIDEGELLTTLSDNSKMWVYFNVPEAEYLQFFKNQKSGNGKQVHLQTADKAMFNYSGVIETIEADFNNETGNIAFRASFPNPEGLLRHGETGNILMPVTLKQALLIPQKATFEILDKKYVFVIDDKNVVHSQQIIIGEEMPHVYVVIDGLKATDKILLDGLRKVKNNEKIQFEFMAPQKAMADLHSLHAE